MFDNDDDVLNAFRLLAAGANGDEDPTLLRIRAMALTSRLKMLNRSASGATRLCRDATAAARLDMDQSHLGLQNLQYEKRHLEREIEKCRQFAYVLPPLF